MIFVITMNRHLGRLSWAQPSLLLALTLLVACARPTNLLYANPSLPSVADYESIQAAVDANPGTALWVPPGDYLLDKAVVISADGTWLQGLGRLIQRNPAAAVIRAHDAKDVRFSGLTLMRAEDCRTATEPAIEIDSCQRVVLDDLRVIDNCSKQGAIALANCSGADIRSCLVENYSRVTIDDRTQGREGKLYGYAFHCIDGSGITVIRSRDVLIQSNRVIENRLRPSREMKAEFELGQFAQRCEERGELVSPQVWESGYVNNWHQGSAIMVGSPEQTEYVRILDNFVENAGQGIDIHADHVTVRGNMVVDAFVGMKAMHGSRCTLISDNHFSKNTLWAIGLMPGATSKLGNEDGDSIISNNIISEFGGGYAAWMWPPEDHTCAPIRLDCGQTADNPPIRNVVISGNVIQQSTGDGDAAAGRSSSTPRYKFALLIETGPGSPQQVIALNNQFPPGTEGVTNQ